MWIGSLVNLPLDTLALRFWGNICKAWEIVVKGIYQLPPHILIEFLHSNIWKPDGIELINNGISYAKAMSCIEKGIQYVGDIWDSEYHTFLSWDDAQTKFHLTNVDNEDWISLTFKIIDKWRLLLDKVPEAIYLRQWLGFYCQGAHDPAFMLQRASDFIPSRRL